MHRAVDGERRSKEDRAARYQQSLGTSLPKRALSADGRSLTYVAKAEMPGFWGRADQGLTVRRGRLLTRCGHRVLLAMSDQGGVRGSVEPLIWIKPILLGAVAELQLRSFSAGAVK